VSRRLRDLTLANLDGLPAACRACVFWEVPGAPRGPDPIDPERGRAGKEAWWRVTELEWGIPGKAVYAGDRLVGYATFAPASHLRRRLGSGASDDAIMLATLWVEPEQRGGGLAKVLLQSVLRETYRRGGRALEAYGARGAGSRPSGPCVLPEAFLLACGFSVIQEHASFPLLRVEVRQLARWPQSVGHALESVVSALARRERAGVPVRPALQAARSDRATCSEAGVPA
jgi:GNAT superfamily N-acetyltransferase